jgi:hypothetical protein
LTCNSVSTPEKFVSKSNGFIDLELLKHLIKLNHKHRILYLFASHNFRGCSYLPDNQVKRLPWCSVMCRVVGFQDCRIPKNDVRVPWYYVIYWYADSMSISTAFPRYIVSIYRCQLISAFSSVTLKIVMPRFAASLVQFHIKWKVAFGLICHFMACCTVFLLVSNLKIRSSFRIHIFTLDGRAASSTFFYHDFSFHDAPFRG